MSSVERSRVLWRRMAGVALVAWLLLTAAGFSQGGTPGQVDTSFNSGGTGADRDGAFPVFAYPDGRTLIWGWFSSYNGVNRRYLARLLPDGSLDESFNPGTGTNSDVQGATVLPDGKILVHGIFTTFNGIERRALARLHPDGSLDQSFNANFPRISTVTDAFVNRIQVQPDGKLLVAGKFLFPGEQTERKLARLNADGSPDLSFKPLGSLDDIRALAIQPDGKILVGGYARERESQLYGFFRLQADGSVDRDFQPVIRPNATNVVTAVEVQPDGKILIGGPGFLLRLNPDGTTDTSFGSGLNLSYSAIYRIILQPDGKVLVGGEIQDGQGLHYAAYLRFNGDGSLDPDFEFNSDIGWAWGLQAMIVDAAGRILIASPYFKSPIRIFGGEPAASGAGTARLQSSSYRVSEASERVTVAIARTGGNTEALTVNYSVSGGNATAGTDFSGSGGSVSFAPGETWKQVSFEIINDSTLEGDELFTVSLDGSNADPASATVTILDDERPGRLEWRPDSIKAWEDEGKITLTVSRSGETMGPIEVNYTTVDGTALAATDYITATGTLSFEDGENLKTVEVSIAEDALCEGPETFQLVLSSSTPGVTLGTRSTATVTIADNDGPGSHAPDFTTGITTSLNGGDSPASCVAELPNGKLLVGGIFDTYGGVVRRSLVLLNANGSVDESFNSSLVSPANVSQIQHLPDGKLLLCGWALRTGTGVRTDLVRLNADGSLDSTFNPGAPNGRVNAIALQPDGKLLVAGTFTAIGGGSRTYFARLLPDGSLDTTFTVTSASSSISTLLVQPDGKILAEGGGLLRVHPGGETDVEFRSNVDQSIQISSLDAVALQPDGHILLGGTLRTNAQTVVSIVRLRADGTIDPLFEPVKLLGESYWRVTHIAVQPDGRIVISGLFNTVNGVPRPGIARLNTDGTIDLTFDSKIAIAPLALLSSGDLVGNVSVLYKNQLQLFLGGQADVSGAGTLSFTWPDVAVSEMAGEVVLNITREGGNEGEVSVAFITSNGTALAGSDYTAVSGTVAFGHRETVKQVRIPIIDNMTPDGARRFTVSLSSPGGGAALGNASTATVTIKDSERAGRLQLNAPSYMVRESSSGLPVQIKRTLGAEGQVTVRIATVDGTAKAGEDYTVVATTVAFEPGETEKVVTIPVLKDGMSEGDETFSVVLSNPTGSAELSPLVNESSAPVKVIDIDDPGSLDESFKLPLSETNVLRAVVAQPNGKLVIAVQPDRSRGPDTSITRLSPDVSPDPSFTAPLLNDQVNALLLQPDGKLVIAGSFTRVGSTDRARIARLNADGSLDPTFLPPQFGGSNGIGSLGLQSDGKIVVSGTFTSVDDTPQAFLARLEPDGSFDSSYRPKLDAAQLSVGRFIVTPNNKVIYANQQGQLIQLLSDGTIDPGFKTSLGTTFTTPRIYSFQRDYWGRLLVGGSFTHVDRVARKNIVRLLPDGRIDTTFDAGNLFATPPERLVVQVDGRVLAGGYDESAIRPSVVRLMPNGLEDTTFRTMDRLTTHFSGLQLLPNSTVLVMGVSSLDGVPVNGVGRLLLGPQPGAVRFTTTAIEVSENANEISVTVERFGGSDGELTVQYETLPGTALPATDYSSVEGVLTFADGETSRSFAVPITDDQAWEYGESFSVRLQETSGVYIPQETGTLTITVNDDDLRLPGKLQFAAVDVQSVESAGYARVTVERVHGSDDVVEVKYATVDGNAQAGLDYVATSGTLRFEHGQISREIEIPLLNNSLVESTESFAVHLSEPSGGADLGTTVVANITILDVDDASTINAFRGAYRGLIHREEGLSGAITVSLAARGQATASLTLDGRRYTLRGKFDADGRFKATLSVRNSTPLVLSLQLDVPGELTGRIAGTLEIGGTVYNLTADKAPYNTRIEPAPMAGRYTCVLESDPADTAAPRGHGVGSVTVAKDGSLRFVGVLADGTKVTQGTNLSGDRRWALFASLYAGKGGVSGIAQFTESGVSWDFAGGAYWLKTPRARDRRYAEGIDTQLSIIGSPLPAKQASASLFGFSEATLSLVNGESALEKDLTLTPGDRFRIERAPERLTLSLNRSTGLITGSFIHPVSRRSVPIRAIVLPDEQRAAGFFLSPTSSGAVSLQER